MANPASASRVAHSVDRAVRAGFFCEAERGIGDVGRDDFRRARAPRRDDAERADRPGAGNDHALAEQFARAPRGVQANRERLGHRGFAQRHALGDRLGLRLVADQHFAKRALHMREAHRAAVEAHVEAMVLLALEAIAAMVARAARIDRDARAGLDPLDLRADGLDDARDFVAEDHRLAQAHRSEAAVVVIMQVRAADAAEGDAHANVARAERGDFRLLDPQILRRMGDHSAHAFPPWRGLSPRDSGILSPARARLTSRPGRRSDGASGDPA